MLAVTESEIILGMTIDDNLLFFDKHIYTAVEKGYNFSNMLLSNIKGANIETYRPMSLFKCYVRPILEYGAVIYMPHYMYLINAIEKVQRNFTKKLPGLCNMTHLQRLNVCNIDSLEERRIKIDLIWMYRILYNLISVNLGNNIKLSVNSNTRGNTYKLYKCNFRLDVKKYFFAIGLLMYGILCLMMLYVFTSLSSFKYKIKKTFNCQPFLKGACCLYSIVFLLLHVLHIQCIICICENKFSIQFNSTC